MSCGSLEEPDSSTWARDPQRGQSPRGQGEGLEGHLHACSGLQLPDGGEVHSTQTPFHGRAGGKQGPAHDGL